MTSLCNIDGDIVAYRCAASCEKRDKEGNLLSCEPVDIALLRTDKLVREILDFVKTPQYNIYVSGQGNFRYEVDPEYKANRRGKADPVWREACKAFLITEWKASVTDGYEADDALGMAQTDDSILASIDKDLLQIPGKHYRWQISGPNWVKEAELLDITYFEGLKHFYASSLIGDRTDNITGVVGIGPAKAAKALNHCTTEQELYEVCKALYKDDERFHRNLKLLWVWRKENDIFDPQERQLSVDPITN